MTDDTLSDTDTDTLLLPLYSINSNISSTILMLVFVLIFILVFAVVFESGSSSILIASMNLSGGRLNISSLIIESFELVDS